MSQDILNLLNQADLPVIDESQLFLKPIQLDEFNSTDFNWVQNVHINTAYLQELATKFERVDITRLNRKQDFLLKIIELIDLTTLSGDDTEEVVQNLTRKAIHPLSDQLTLKAGRSIHTAAVCVYPARVKDVVAALNEEKARDVVKVASVAAGFPSGQYMLESRLHEIQLLAKQRVDEIDVVIQRPLALTGQWSTLYSEVRQMKDACGQSIHMKTILGVGELGCSENIYGCSIVAMLAGSDFIKTSTGKEKVNATIPAGIVMSVAIKHFFKLSGKRVGLKPAGGLSTLQDCARWIYMLCSVLGAEWFKPDLFRIGASSLLGNLLQDLQAC